MILSSKVTPWVAPFAVFMLFLVIVDGHWPDEHYLLYPFKSLLVAAVIAWGWRALPTLRPAAPLVSVAVGAVGVVIWVGMEPLSNALSDVMTGWWNTVVGSVGLKSWQTPLETLHAPGLNPFQLYPAPESWALFACRVAGITLIVPVMEELFWRGFLMRWLIQDDFTAVPLGTYAPVSFWVTTILFASVHSAEWPQGLVVGVIYGALFVRTKSLGSIMLAHGVTNFLLGCYCLYANDWHFLASAHEAQLPK